MLTLENKKIFAVLFLFLAFLFTPVQRASADAWGSNYAAAMLTYTLNQIDRTIQGMILGTAKQLAAEMVHRTVGKMILGGDGGSNGGPLYITNWDQYLYTDVANSANLVVNDFFTLASRGTNSAINYATEGAVSGTIGYTNYLTLQAQQSINGVIPHMDLQSYVSSPPRMFDQPGMRGFMAFTSNYRDPIGFTLLSKQIYQNAWERERSKAEIQAQAYQGFKAQKSGDIVVTPGSTIKDVQTAAENIGYNIIAAANNVPEIIATTVIQTTGEIILQGIGNARSDVQRKANNQINSVRRDVKEAIQQGGPGTVFKPTY